MFNLVCEQSSSAPHFKQYLKTSFKSDLKGDNEFITYYCDQAAQIVRGERLKEMLLYWGGDERGIDFKGPRQNVPVCIPISTQYTHACGIASAFKIRHQKRG